MDKGVIDMGCTIIGKVTIVVNNGSVVIGTMGTIDPTIKETAVRGAGSDVFSTQIRDTINDVRDEIGKIALPEFRVFPRLKFRKK